MPTRQCLPERGECTAALWRRAVGWAIAGVIALLGGLSTLRGQDGASQESGASNATETPAPATPEFPVDAERVSVAEARRQAEVLHTAMHSAVQLTHHRFYKEDEGLPIPAAVVREMFEDVHADHPARLRWLVVEGQAMNSDHLAGTPFEQAAVDALKSGVRSYERVEGGVYRRAGPIRLHNACLKCHVPDRKSTEDRTAGLLIAIPVLPE